MKGLNKTDTPIFIILCVFLFSGATFIGFNCSNASIRTVRSLCHQMFRIITAFVLKYSDNSTPYYTCLKLEKVHDAVSKNCWMSGK